MSAFDVPLFVRGELIEDDWVEFGGRAFYLCAAAEKMSSPVKVTAGGNGDRVTRSRSGR